MTFDAETIKDGGVIILCILVMVELRGIRPALEGIKLILSATLERERIRDGRKRPPSDPPQSTTGVPNEFDVQEDTGLVSIIEKLRGKPATPPKGIRPPRPGTHHDGER